MLVKKLAKSGMPVPEASWVGCGVTVPLSPVRPMRPQVAT
jgi:hypothetical protein